MRHLLNYLDEELEGKIILNSILIFKYPKYSITKTAFDFERPKLIPSSNTIVVTKVTAVTLTLNQFL
jgi:hypothetical protein